jgi:HD-GYP domain-containing protein (c-di-GMP phosphodiesterase class II)
MKLISLKKVTDNTILAKDICSYRGSILLPKGALLKHNYAILLEEWGVHSVYIQDDYMDRIEIDEELLQQTQEEIRQIMTGFLEKMADGQLPESVSQMLEATIERLLADQNILPYLVEIKELSAPIFKHSIDVCTLAVSMGALSGYDSKQLQELATGAILIDLGKMVSPKHLVGNIGELPAPESIEIQKHPEIGYDMLQKLGDEYENSASVILQHHERYDGTGFPNGLKGDQIHQYAKITTIVDSYLSCRTAGNECQKISPSEMLKYIEAHAGILFDPDFTRLFSQKIAPLIINKPDGSEGGGEYPQISSINPNPQNENQEPLQRMKDELFRLQESFLSKMDTQPIPELVIQVIRSVMDELVSGNEVMNDIMACNPVNEINDKHIFQCMSVGLLSVLTGVSLGYTVEQLKELGTGSIALELEKEKFFPMPTAEPISPEYFSSVLEYARSGFERLEQRKNNFKSTGNSDSHPGAPLQPLKSGGTNYREENNSQLISNFAEITGLAEIYHTIIERGIGGKALMPHEVIEYVRDHGGVYFDPQLTRLFLQSVTPFLIGSYVLLNTGEKAKVLKIHKDLTARPVIRVITDRVGNQLADPVEKDLEKDLTLFIVRALKDDEI